MNSTKLYFLLACLLTAVTLVGVGYVLQSGGAKSPGYAVIPMLCANLLWMMWHKSKKTEK
ncbi:MAG: hypothetical protein IIY94_07825 [Oscillospiraceae bacterium]|nr:hypothetical protein [Oscillospiraceae bacterium]